MRMNKVDAINLIRHMVGNSVVEGRLLHSGKSFRTPDDVREIQRGVVCRLREKLKKDNITDPGVGKILLALEENDWGDKSSYETFRSIYDVYVTSVDDEATQERDKLFGERNKLK